MKFQDGMEVTTSDGYTRTLTRWTKYGKDRHTAEIVYRYLFNNDFVESHTALEDCEIEYQILLSCLEKNGNCDTLLW